MGLLSKFIRKVRTSKIAPYINGSVLDLGCGDAVVLRLFSQKIKTYYGVEYDCQRIEKLKRSFPQHNFSCADLDEGSFAFSLKFDAILLLAVIEHVFNQKHLFNQILKNLKSDGVIIITTPTPLGDLVHRIGAKLGLFARSADDHHITIYNKRRFKVLADYFNLKIITYKRFALGCNQLVVMTKTG